MCKGRHVAFSTQISEPVINYYNLRKRCSQGHTTPFLKFYDVVFISERAFSALTLLVGHQEEQYVYGCILLHAFCQFLLQLCAFVGQQDLLLWWHCVCCWLFADLLVSWWHQPAKDHYLHWFRWRTKTTACQGLLVGTDNWLRIDYILTYVCFFKHLSVKLHEIQTFVSRPLELVQNENVVYD